jgi:hypothetical protein
VLPAGRKTSHQETLGYSSSHGGYGAVEFGESIKQSFSDKVPASIDCAVIFIVMT